MTSWKAKVWRPEKSVVGTLVWFWLYAPNDFPGQEIDSMATTKGACAMPKMGPKKIVFAKC